jgi:hypothetical protein
MKENSIDSALGLRPIDEALADQPPSPTADSDTMPEVIDDTAIEIIPVNVEEDETYKDIEQARSNIKNIIEKGDESLKEMIELAKQSESPRAFEVASGLMKTLLDANKDFVDMSMKKKYQREELSGSKEEAQTNITNNNLVISTADLLRMMKGDAE